MSRRRMQRLDSVLGEMPEDMKRNAPEAPERSPVVPPSPPDLWHHSECWRVPRHHACAVVMIEDARKAAKAGDLDGVLKALRVEA